MTKQLEFNFDYKMNELSHEEKKAQRYKGICVGCGRKKNTACHPVGREWICLHCGESNGR